MDNDDEKYLDPEQNPFIWTGEEPKPLKDDGEISDPFLDPGKNPFIQGNDGGGFYITPEALTEKLAAAYPGKDEITIGSRILVRMATGTFTEKESGKPIDELPLADLMMIGDFLRDREKG